MDWNGHWTEVKIIFVVGSTEEFGWFHSKKLARELTNINQTIKKMIGQVKWMGGLQNYGRQVKCVQDQCDD